MRPTALRLLLSAAMIMVMTMAVVMVVADDEALPELGDGATQILTPSQEEAIGRQFLRQLLSDPDYVDDPELRAYLNRIGDRIVSHVGRDIFITLNLLRDPIINAFAVPGGYLTFHTGLITAAADESELAAVVAHETAHISQRHLPRMLAKAEESKLPAAAAILASVLIGGEAGLAGITVANAALLSNQLAYTRDFEREADSIGLKLLAEAGYDPTAMGRFFNKLDYTGGRTDQIPEYLRTHPLSYTRIAEAESRADAYPSQEYPSARAFHFARAKVRALYRAEDEARTIAYLEDRADNAGGHRGDAARYGLALVRYKQRQFAAARATLQPLLDAYPDDVPVNIARAEIDITAGDAAAAAARYTRLVEAHPDHVYLTYYQVKALLEAGDAAAAKRAVRHQLRRHKDRFDLYPLLSRSNVALGMMAEAHQANAEYYAALGDYHAAISSLKLALREQPEGSYLHQSLTARIAALEENLAF